MKRLYLLGLCLLLMAGASAQSNKKRKAPSSYNKQNKELDKFLQKQWWLGFKAGTNLTKVNVDKVYDIVAPTNYVASDIAKKYTQFKDPGLQATLEVTFYYKGISFSLQPTYQHTVFSYSNTFQWTSTTVATNRLDLTYKQDQRLDHAVIPLVIKYEIAGNKFRPYLQAGFYTAFLINASKSLQISGVDYASGGQNKFEDEPIMVGAKDLFAKKHWGLTGGLGAYYNLGNVRLNFDAQYRYGMSNIVSSKNRYGNDRLTGVGDAMDDLTMDNIYLSVGCLFPMRFLESGFKSLDRK